MSEIKRWSVYVGIPIEYPLVGFAVGILIASIAKVVEGIG